MKVKSILNKFINKAKAKIVLKNFKGNLYYNKKVDKPKKVLIFLKNPEFFHLGDCLFFEPLLRSLKESGIDVSVAVPNSMEFYFEKLGYLLNDGKKIKEFDLIISRIEVYTELKEYENLLLYEYITSDMKKPICDEIIEKVLDFILLEKKINFDTSPSKINVNSNIKLDEGSSYILFNNYLDSSKLFTRKSYYKSLNEVCINKSNLNKLKVIHLGSSKEKEKDNYIYNFVDYDLRGMTTVEDLFYLVNHPKVVMYIGFDTFPMHLSTIYEKTCFVKLRNFITKTRFNTVRRCFIPSFISKNRIEIEEII